MLEALDKKEKEREQTKASRALEKKAAREERDKKIAAELSRLEELVTNTNGLNSLKGKLQNVDMMKKSLYNVQHSLNF